jgi:tRNA splicing ligase
VPVLGYSFEMVNCFRKEIENIDQKIRKLITTEGIHHPKADVNRLCIKRQNGGRGLFKLESAYNAAIVGLSTDINL